VHCRSINDGMSRSPVMTDEVGLWSSLSPTGRPAGSVQRYTESFGPAGTCLPCASVDLTTPCTLVLPAYYWATNSIWPSKKRISRRRWKRKSKELLLFRRRRLLLLLLLSSPLLLCSSIPFAFENHPQRNRSGEQKGDGR
jgi:hypothetical protein